MNQLIDDPFQGEQSMKNYGWSHFDHRADMGIEGRGPSMAMAFSQAGLALNAVISDLGSVKPVTVRNLYCRDDNPEMLFFDFINELIYLIAQENMIFSEIKAAINGPELEAELRGETIDPLRHDPSVEIKGASFSELSVKKNRSGQWVARCVVDV